MQAIILVVSACKTWARMIQVLRGVSYSVLIRRGVLGLSGAHLEYEITHHGTSGSD